MASCSIRPCNTISFFLSVIIVTYLSLFQFSFSSTIAKPPSSFFFSSDIVPHQFKREAFSPAFANLWSSDHQHISDDDLSVNLTLDRHSGSGFRSKSQYHYGLFSAAIKLPANNSAGVAITFYTSNNGVYRDTHDEIDFEFLGVLPGEQYTVQTNVYANGSTNTGREQRFHLWFDPTADYHEYAILWTRNHTVFLIDWLPIREYKNAGGWGSEYPSKPMSVYGTIWDASSWATDGGRYKTNYTYAPFVVSYRDFVLQGCEVISHAELPGGCSMNSNIDYLLSNPHLTSDQEMGLQWVRQNYMVYDYCKDSRRYPQQLPECRLQTAAQKNAMESS